MRANLDREGGLLAGGASGRRAVPAIGHGEATALVSGAASLAVASGRPFADVLAADPVAVDICAGGRGAAPGPGGLPRGHRPVDRPRAGGASSAPGRTQPVSGAVAVHHVDDGPAGAPVVVLAHAIGTSLTMWEPQVVSLARHFRVVRYDARGHGASPVPEGPYELGDLGGDLLALLDELRVARAHIVGLSLGAMVGLWVAAHAPDRVDRLVACSVTARPPRPEAWRERAAAVRAGGTRAVVDLVVERWGYVDRAPEIREQVVRMLLATPAEGYAGSCEAIATMNLEPDLPIVTAPTLLISGAGAIPPRRPRPTVPWPPACQPPVWRSWVPRT